MNSKTPLILVGAAIILAAMVTAYVWRTDDRTEQIRPASLHPQAERESASGAQSENISPFSSERGAQANFEHDGNPFSPITDTDELDGAQAREPLIKRERRIRDALKQSGDKPLGMTQIQPLLLGIKDQSVNIRATAVTALGKSRSIHAIEPLVDMLMDPNVQVRVRAQNAMKKLVGVEIKYNPASGERTRMAAVRRLRNMIPSMIKNLDYENSQRSEAPQ